MEYVEVLEANSSYPHVRLSNSRETNDNNIQPASDASESFQSRLSTGVRKAVDRYGAVPYF